MTQALEQGRRTKRTCLKVTRIGRVVGQRGLRIENLRVRMYKIMRIGEFLRVVRRKRLRVIYLRARKSRESRMMRPRVVRRLKVEKEETARESWKVSRKVMKKAVRARRSPSGLMRRSRILETWMPRKNSKGTPTDERTARRHSRRVKNAEEAPPASQLQKLRLRDEDGSDDDVSQVQETPAGTRNVSPEVLEERYEAERKRKGKQEAKAHKKKPRQASKAVVIEEPTPKTIRVQFEAVAGEESKPEEPEEETENPPEEEGVYEKMEVLVTKRLLETMVQFSDPKHTKECEGRVGNGKVAKSRKSMCLSDLRDLGAEEKLISYFNSIGFEWLLDHCDKEVPVPLAKEFFTSF